MNKVIKKMLKEAEEYADINALLTDELEPMMLEHFADLIIWKCLEICQARGGAGIDCAEQIEEYFGVEK